ncbi:methyltransferase [Rhizobium sp. P32RR-XVIII]|uniref:methyltransferase n=1 Tax=Rhizobium sp. P32RR-XVIII TaxID=2726738 RepID=UPI001456492A|nr:methyltransferase [Rhizobium sp. P32RR-XVIII]NLS08112.1 methyltransferase [Rhizobium sp. P32RR-XVIII]
MENKNYLNDLEPDYELDIALQIFKRNGYGGIPYSDGSEIEARLERIVAETVDRSVLSDPLREHCTDWVTTYHLSPIRANIVRPFSKEFPGADVLEIGAGCGAITRFLGESGARVLALEGSIRRARIARLRTLELENVDVLAERFSDFKTERQFDFITLIGVLEYAGLYSEAKDPAADMLERIHKLLKPGGRLIIAIENQLGLKYFAGALEDHLSQRMLGIEGRYQPGGVQTFGRQELERRVLASGFVETELLLPFPDYKLPTSIVTATAFGLRDFDAAAIAAQSVRRDPQLPQQPLFAPELVWPQIAANGIAADLSNSLLLIAYASPQPARKFGPIAWHFAAGRKGNYCKQTTFEQQADGQILVQNHRLGSLVEDDDASSMRFCPEPEAPYLVGQLLSEQFLSIIANDGWKIESVANFFQAYRTIVHDVLSREDGSYQAVPLGYDFEVPGSFIDAVPQNLVRMEKDGWRFFDREWSAPERLPFRYLVFRSVTTLAGLVTTIGRSADLTVETWGELLAHIFGALHLPSFEACRDELVTRESNLHECVFGTASDHAIRNFFNTRLPVRNDVFQRVESLTNEVHGRDATIRSLTNEVHGRDATIRSLTNEVHGRDATIRSLDAEAAFLRSEIERLNQLLSSAQRLVHRAGKFPFSAYFRTKKKYRKILREIREAPFSNLPQPATQAKTSAVDVPHPAGYKAEILKGLVPQVAAPPISLENLPLENHATLAADALCNILADAPGPRGTILSFSHDHYLTIAGGTQLCIGLEEEAARDAGFRYLHAHPLRAIPTLASSETASLPSLRLSLNGRALGITSHQTLVEVVERMRNKGSDIHVIIHHLMGHDSDSIAQVVTASGRKRCTLWLHDFFTLCPSPHLLRNNVSFCGAPRVSSASCSICAYSALRRVHSERMKSLFKQCDVDLIAPSNFVADLFRAQSDLPFASLRVQPHLEITWTTNDTPKDVNDRPVRVAFVGIPANHKGWPNFRELALHFRNDPHYEFLYFGSSAVTDGIKSVQVTTSGKNRMAMTNALREADVDIVLHTSPTPETFSFTAHEAIAAGAFVVTNSATGNTARMVDRTGHGLVLKNEGDIFAMFKSGEIQRLADKARRLRATKTANARYSRMTIPTITSESA